MALVSVADNVWVLDQPLRFPLLGDLGTRMTILRLSDRSLMLISPVKFGEEVKQELKQLGEVKYIVAPNAFHHLYLSLARSAFPGTKAYGPIKLRFKRRDVVFAEFLDPAKRYPWSEEVDMLLFPGRDDNDEFVFFHKATRTLIVADLVFNVADGHSFFSRLLLRANQAIGLGMTRIGKRVFKDREKLRDNLRTLIQWKPERLVLSHGDLVHEAAGSRLEKSFQWLLSHR